MAFESASQSPSGLNNSAPGFVVPGLSLPDMGVGSDVCNSLALQQYQFDQLISNVLEVNYVEQQADALAISIKAAAERAAVHAADISRLLNDEKCDRCDAPEVKNVELKRKREQPERKPHSWAPSSPTSLKSKSISPLHPRHVSPIKPRNSGREEYSRSDFRSRSHRKPSSHGRHDDQRNYTKSRHKRGDVDRSVDRESHDRYTSSSRRRSPLARKRSSRHQHDGSGPPQRSRSRSRSPRPRHRKPSRVQNERRISKSPLNSNRIYSPRSSMRTTPRDDFSRRGLSPTLSTRSVLMEENKVDNNDFSRSLSPNNKVEDSTLNLAVNSREVEDKRSSKSLKNRSSYTSRSRSTSEE
ncbi:pre-mRNA-splicing factor cwc25-like [Papaver somniferum]|uniref:pre-mRNA-splicing factor cwc25-like n=1 Tax=Papaver somniferum TaxID=3469 RepID=UPI000E6F8C00|nr:pre-mRNA-splicing factor cwc25-like [Papaver somniferum]